MGFRVNFPLVKAADRTMDVDSIIISDYLSFELP
jgi:hypothetical protein